MARSHTVWEGYRTIQFESGIAFLDSLDSGPGACVLLDVKAVQAMRAGAADFLEKPVSRDRLLASIAQAIDVRRNAQQNQRERSDIGTRIGALTIRERQVLEQLVMGRANKVAAHELGISSRTVEVYRRNVMAKMGADSLSHLVRMTLVAGIDPLGDKALPALGTR